MNLRVSFAMASLLFTAAACGGEVEHSAVTTLKVEIDKLVEAGQVLPVDGITSSGQPDKAALSVFSDSGYVAVIDLRTEDEERGMDEKSTVETLGMDYVTLPIDGSESISFDNARKLDQLIESYDGPVLIHCGSGNRVGALLALRASLNGADDEAALKIGKQGGLTRLESVVRKRLKANDLRQTNGANSLEESVQFGEQ